jgi:hypothetical protein
MNASDYRRKAARWPIGFSGEFPKKRNTRLYFDRASQAEENSLSNRGASENSVGS